MDLWKRSRYKALQGFDQTDLRGVAKPSRFLKWNMETGKWQVASDKDLAIEKMRIVRKTRLLKQMKTFSLARAHAKKYTYLVV